MERTLYAGGSFLPRIEISAALFSYAAELARRASSATVEVPSQRDDGTVTFERLLIGFASEIASEPEDSPHGDLVDEEFVALVRAQEAALRPVAGAIPKEDLPTESELDL